MTQAITVQPSQPMETEVRQLPPAEQFALWAIRVWVAAHRRPANLLPMLRDRFVGAGMQAGWLALDRWMTLFLGSAKRPVEIRSIGFAAVSNDEAALLSWMAAAQRNDAPPGCCAHARRTLRDAQLLAADFAAAGLLFAVSATLPVHAGP